MIRFKSKGECEMSRNDNDSMERPQHFKYIRVGVDFAQQTAQLLNAGENVVLLGPRGIGKQYVMVETKYALRDLGDEHVFEIRLAQERTSDAADLLTSINSSAYRCLAGLGWNSPACWDDVPRALRRFLEATPCHLILLASDVDELPDHVARRFLKEVRILTSLPQNTPGRLTVLLTGSADLAPLVYGADSEFTCPNQYVIQGYDRAAFGKYVDQLRFPNGWSFDDAHKCHEKLYEQCGGHIYLLRVIFCAILEGRRIRNIPPSKPITESEITKAVEHLLSTGANTDLVMRAFARLETSVEAFSSVPELLTRGEVELPTRMIMTGASLRETPPTELELSGLAIRTDRKLRFASPLMESFTRRFFSEWTVGDYFACNNQWHKAFIQYLNAERVGQPWVCSTTQRPRLRTALRAFETALFGVATKHTESLELLNDFFVTGAKFLLGFEEITFWENDGAWRQLEKLKVTCNSSQDEDNQPSWRMIVPTDQGIPPETLSKCRSVLPEPEILSDGLHSIVGHVNEPYAMVVGLPSKEDEAKKVIVLSNFGTQTPLTRDRRTFCEEVAKSYCGAYAQARSIEQQARKTRIQHYLLRAIPAILKAVSGKPVTTKAALETAAERLRQTGYRRVMFSMVDRETRRIVGVFDSRSNGEPDVAKMTDFSLAHSMQDIEDVQQYVVLTGEMLRIPDATKYPSTTKATVNAARMRAIAILPMKLDGSVIGTMHVERMDKTLPQPEELSALEYFVSQLATVIGLTARFEMCETAMNLQPDAILLLDEQRRLRYANREATQFVPVEPGWQNEGTLKCCSQDLPDKLLEVFNEACKANRELRGYLRSDERSGKWEVAHAAPIRDWRNAQAGGLLQIQDLTLMKRILESLKSLAACRTKEELLDSVLEAIRALGHRWARLYLIDHATEMLVGQRQYGIRSAAKGAQMFVEGKVQLPPRSESANSWMCIDRETPIIFSTDDGRNDGDEYMSSSGLKILNVSDPDCPSVVAKRPGERWIDVPLFAREHDRPLGKMSVDFSNDYTPEQFERLRIHAEVASALLVAMDYREKAREKVALERAIGETAHQLLAKLASLGTLTYRYEAVGDDPLEISKLNKEFDRRLRALQQVLQEVRDRMRPIKIDLQRNDLVELVRQTLEEQLPEGAFDILTGHPHFDGDFDAKLIKECFEELVMNAKKAASGKEAPKLRVHLENVGEGLGAKCRVSICDNGPGIPVELRERVFEDLFSQWPGGERGSGIGLGFVRRIIEAHDGSIRVGNSRSGACFVIEFPRFGARLKSAEPDVGDGLVHANAVELTGKMEG